MAVSLCFFWRSFEPEWAIEWCAAVFQFWASSKNDSANLRFGVKSFTLTIMGRCLLSSHY